ncbi:hypothetical protein GQ600_6681 [Phytophthora cactorum]|nr:hypothetical protein GQ600_6681 [Phytophthora cactorum]
MNSGLSVTSQQGEDFGQGHTDRQGLEEEEEAVKAGESKGTLPRGPSISQGIEHSKATQPGDKSAGRHATRASILRELEQTVHQLKVPRKRAATVSRRTR